MLQHVLSDLIRTNAIPRRRTTSKNRLAQGCLHRSHNNNQRRRKLLLESLEDRRVLSTFNVLNTNDSGSGSLRQAIIDANGNVGPDDIQFDAGLSGAITITLTSGEIAITDEVHLDGPSSKNISISGNNASGIFVISANSTIDDLKFTAGMVGDGTGIIYSSASSLTINGSEFNNNAGTSIYNTGTLAVHDSEFKDNVGFLYTSVTIQDPVDGPTNQDYHRVGGIHSEGSLTVTSSNFTRNTGGGIYSTGSTVDVSHSSFSSNTGTAIYNTGSLTLNSSTVDNNTGVLYQAVDYTDEDYRSRLPGGVHNTGIAIITESDFSANVGGSVYNSVGSLTVSDSDFDFNTGTTFKDPNLPLEDPYPKYTMSVGAGIYNTDGGTADVANSTFSSNDGNAVFNYFPDLQIDENGSWCQDPQTLADLEAQGVISSLNVTSSTFSGNIGQAGGGVFNLHAYATIVDSSFIKNQTKDIPFNAGGAVNAVQGGTLVINNSTFVENESKYGGGISATFCVWTFEIDSSTFYGNHGSRHSGGLFNYIDSPLTLNNSIFADNTGGWSGTDDIGDFDSLSGTNNLIKSQSYGGLQNGVYGVDPKLGPLGNYGGSTWTMPLLPGSPAINAGDDASVPAGVTTDQRGLPRISGGQVDTGAFETQQTGEEFVGTSGNDTIIISAGSDPDTLKVTINGMVEADNIPEVDQGIVYVRGLGGDDSFTISKSTVGHVVVDGGEGADAYDVTFGDLYGTVVVSDSGTIGDDALTVYGTDEPDTLIKNSGSIQWNSSQEVNFAGFDGANEQVTLNAGAGGDTIVDPNSDDFLILGGPGDDTIIVAKNDGHITADGGEGSDTYIIEVLPSYLAYSQFTGYDGTTPYVVEVSRPQGPVTINDTGTDGTDTAIVEGTIENDMITMTGDQIISNDSTFTVNGTEDTTVNGGDGANTYVVELGNLSTPLTIDNTEGTSELEIVAPPGDNTLTLSATGLTSTGTTGTGETVNLNLGTTATEVSVSGNEGDNNQLVLDGPPPGPVTTEQVNAAPVLDSLTATSVDENGTVSLSGTYSDLNAGDTHTLTINWGEGDPDLVPVSVSGGMFEFTHQYLDDPGGIPELVTISVTLTEDNTETPASVPGSVNATITNLAPEVHAISAPLDPNAVTDEIQVSANFTDVGTLDTHTSEWDWGDGSISAGTVTQGSGSGSVTGSHVYTQAGVYTVTLSVTDDDGDAGVSVHQYVVVYDPSAGFVTGGGWINSPAGAYTGDPALSGKANFGFNSRYKKGASVPTGNTEFQFKIADLDFQSTSYEWLVISGAKARFRGLGTINGAGDYGFELTAWDGQANGGGGTDRFRIKIWDQNQGNGVVYDNMLGAADGADPTTTLGGGSIVIHNGMQTGSAAGSSVPGISGPGKSGPSTPVPGIPAPAPPLAPVSPAVDRAMETIHLRLEVENTIGNLLQPPTHAVPFSDASVDLVFEEFPESQVDQDGLSVDLLDAIAVA